ncbi:MAG: DUF2975 domain-containing protein [Ferruginibacter sp.]
MSKRTDYFLIALTVIAWIIFIGLCIEAGGYITNTVITLFLNPEGAKKFWMQIDLSKLYHFNKSHFVMLTSLMIIIAILKALMFYFIVKIFHDKKIDFLKPFNEALNRFIFNTAYLALGIGFFSSWAAKFSGQLSKQGVELPDVQQLKVGGADVWLFMGVTLLVIAFIFKKGVEIQNENDLTI